MVKNETSSLYITKDIRDELEDIKFSKRFKRLCDSVRFLLNEFNKNKKSANGGKKNEIKRRSKAV